ncbi:MAG TPA: SDR family oxidoreductase [Chryseolinea sp.]|nr:SDR family oxidoreductase [Chryseolinea sp.]
MNDHVFDLTGNTVLVTGGGTGLGLGISKSLIDSGAKVIILGRREGVLKKACLKLGERSSYKVFDLSHIDSIPCFVEDLENEIGPVDILVNNAGVHLKKSVLMVTDADFEKTILINQRAVFSLSREFSKKMGERRAGCIIMISSMASRYGIPKVIAYTAAKSAIEGMTRALAVELSPIGIRVNCIAPGFIETEMSSKAFDGDDERKEKVLSRTPMGFLGSPDDVGYAVVYLASKAAKYVTGVILPIDGGNSIGF